MRRRDFIALLGGATAVASRPLPTFAQTPSKRPLIAAQIGGLRRRPIDFLADFHKGYVSLSTSKAAITSSRSAMPTAM